MDQITFRKRAKRDRTAVADRRLWRSACGRFLVVESKPYLSGLSLRVYAIEQLDENRQRIISKHRSRARAEKSIRTYAKESIT